MVNVGHPSNGRVGDPSHHLSLKEVDGSNLFGFISVNEQTNSVLADVQIRPYPGQATQFVQGRSKHADKKPPYIDVALDSFIGGMGMLHHDEDSSRYLDGYMLNSSLEGRTTIQGMPKYTKGLRDFNEQIPDISDECSWREVYAANNTNTEVTFTVQALDDTSYDAETIRLYLRKVGSPTGTITVELRNNTGTKLEDFTFDIETDIPTHSPYWVEGTLSAKETLNDATNYKININYSGGDADNRLEIWYNDTDSEFIYRILDDTAPFRFKMFEFRDALYGVTIPLDGSVSKVYMYGDRGRTDDNSADLSYLEDASKSWVADEWIGSQVKILQKSGEETPWRTIIDNDTDSLEVSPDWKKAHDGVYDAYVIVGNKWRLLQTLSANVSDVAVGANAVYFSFGFPGALGSDYYVRRFEHHTTQLGTLTQEVSFSEGPMKMLIVPNTENDWKTFLSEDLYSIYGYAGQYTTLQLRSTTYQDDCVRTQMILCPNDRRWADTEYANTVTRIGYENLENKAEAAFTTGKFCCWTFDEEQDWRGVADIQMYLKINPIDNPSTGYDAEGEITFIVADADGNEQSYNLDGTTGSFYQERWTMKQPQENSVDLARIKSLYFNAAVDNGAVDVVLRSPIYGTWDEGKTTDQWRWMFPPSYRCNSMLAYAGGAGQTEEKPWLFGDLGVFFLEDGFVKKIPLGELEELAHPRAGEGSCVNGPYVYWNAGEKIERYYAGQLDDIGPDRDYGLPQNRRGIPASMASYPGAVFAGFDCGSSKTSHLMYRRAHGWHEAYRAPISGNRIMETHILARVDMPDQVYISEGADVLYIPFDLNPETADDFHFANHAHVVTPRIYATTRETAKFFKSLELIQELHEDADATPKQSFRVYYKTGATDSWTLLGDYLDGSTDHSEEISIGAYDVSGTWIQFLIEFESRTGDYAPILISAVLDATERLVVKNTYTYNLMIREGPDDCLDGSVETVTGADKVTQLETWAKQELPLILNSNSVFEDGKYVFIEPTRSRFVPNPNAGSGAEVRTYQLTLLEVD